MTLLLPALFGIADSGTLGFAIVFSPYLDSVWGFFDSNNMPILSQLVRPHLRATGYGIMNLASTSFGGFADWGFGALRDAHVSLSIIFGLFSGVCVNLRGHRADDSTAARQRRLTFANVKSILKKLRSTEADYSYGEVTLTADHPKTTISLVGAPCIISVASAQFPNLSLSPHGRAPFVIGTRCHKIDLPLNSLVAR